MMRVDFERDWQERGPGRALYEDMGMRVVESAEGLPLGRDVRAAVRVQGDEATFHVVSGDPSDLAAFEQAMQAPRARVVKHLLEQPDPALAARAQTALAEGRMLPAKSNPVPDVETFEVEVSRRKRSRSKQRG